MLKIKEYILRFSKILFSLVSLIQRKSSRLKIWGPQGVQNDRNDRLILDANCFHASISNRKPFSRFKQKPFAWCSSISQNKVWLLRFETPDCLNLINRCCLREIVAIVDCCSISGYMSHIPLTEWRHRPEFFCTLNLTLTLTLTITLTLTNPNRKQMF